MPTDRKLVSLTLAIYGACFSLGALSHARDFLTHGWLPYQWGVPVLDAFWTSLIVLDVGVVVLLAAGLRRAGLCAATAIMLCDVAANSYALFGRGIQAFAGNLVLQTLFLGFVLGSVAFVWLERRVR